MNEKRIQQIIELEKQADGIYAQAVAEAAQIPVAAESEAEKFLEESRIEAQNEARRLIDDAKVEDEAADILAQVGEKIKNSETSAATNFNRAVAYVLNRVVGRE